MLFWGGGEGEGGYVILGRGGRGEHVILGDRGGGFTVQPLGR